MSKIPKIQTSHAVLLLSGDYILQLRDNKPTISAPGEWSLFGGMLKNGEDPIKGVKREVFEELAIMPDKYEQFGFEDYYDELEKDVIRTWFFEADVSFVWENHQLNEGRDVGAFSFEELSELKIPSVMRKTIERHYELSRRGTVK